MRYLNTAISALILTSAFTLKAQEPVYFQSQQDEAVQALRSLQDKAWSYVINQSPELATFVGCDGEHGKWTDFSLEAFEKRKGDSFIFKVLLDEIDRTSLSKGNQLQYDILKWLINIADEGSQYPFQYLPIDQLNGIHLTVPLLLQMGNETTSEGYKNLLNRMNGVPTLIDQNIALMVEGMKAGIVPPKIIMRSVPEQISAQIFNTPEDSEFFKPFALIEDEELKAQALMMIEERIYPSFAKLHDFIVQTYIPACRDSIGFSDLPNGRQAYAHLVKMHTTTNLTPNEIHQIGLDEVERIYKEMTQVIQDVEFDGSIHDFANYLKQDENSYYKTKEELLQGFRDLLALVGSNLPQLFNNIPSLPCEVLAIPEYSEASSIGAYYYPGSVETGRPGRFFANTHNLHHHPKWMMESLALHEALPGHHFQITIAQQAEIPMIQKHSWTTAFVEGWGLYSESLGKELGLYQNPYSYFGRLVNEMLRALRLVVDTGLHDQSWTRQQAIDYYKQYLPVDENEITNEIDRYIVMPGQALAYKIGELKLLSLRSQARENEGEAFDIRAFHDKLLQLGGCLPLDALEAYFF